jgi:hypothetical protein
MYTAELEIIAEYINAHAHTILNVHSYEILKNNNFNIIV